MSVCVCVCVSEGDKDGKYNFRYPWKPIVLMALKIQNYISNPRPKEIHRYLKNVTLILSLVFKMTKQHFDFKLRQLKLNIRQNKIGIRTVDFCKLWTRSTRLQLMPKPGYYQGDIC